MADKNKESENPANFFPKMEEQVLDFWEKNKIFEKSVEREASKGDYVFYDGPPFATGTPHYGHLLSSISKDVVPRFWTMRGYRVERRWGWDCHGLPIENIIEQDLKISGKKEIEKIGIARFNEACRARVLEYADIWGKTIRRIGRWVEFKNSYKTMDLSYMESVWWAFKELWKKDLIYEGRKVLLYCPRCETPISNFEVAMDNSYKDITEKSVTVKFKITNKNELKANFTNNADVFLLAWTTTPWTLPGNVALAVGEKLSYLVFKVESLKDNKIEYYIVAEKRAEVIADKFNIDVITSGWKALLAGHGKDLTDIQEPQHQINLVAKLKGKDLVGLEYEPLFEVPALKNSGKKVYRVVAGDFVTTEEGTGIVHTAVVYGEDDYNLGLKLDLPVIPALDNKGHFNETVPQFKGVYFLKANSLIIEDLEKRGLLFKAEDYKHSYPHCHRCETQLFYNAIPAWFLKVSQLKKKMLALNKKINWFPEHLKLGRFAQGIEQAPDWNISRNRFFATPMPVWRCEKCGGLEVIGSVAELREKSGEKNIADIHNHKINHLSWLCAKCQGMMKRVSEVFDCWVESGSMPFAQHHYPFENKKKFENNFPAQYITEYISQTRAWFYVTHVLSTALFDSHSFENVVATGVILNEKGEKLSKSKKNFSDPWKMIDRFGADALRYYLMSSAVMQAENLFFSERDLQDVFRKNIMVLWNVYKFYEMFTNERKLSANKRESNKTPLNPPFTRRESNVLDQWILARLNQLTAEVTENMNNYNLPKAARPIGEFINDLSTWYIRRSRERFKSDDAADKQNALTTTRFVLSELAKIMAPFMPFMAETIWQKVAGYDFKDENKSAHLENWPKQSGIMNYESRIMEEMQTARKIVELGLAERDKAGIKVRQPLGKFLIFNFKFLMKEEYLNLIKDELNVREVAIKKGAGELKVELDTAMTDELKLKGLKREIVRLVNAMRKQAGLTIKDKIILSWQSDSEMVEKAFAEFGEEIKKDTLSSEIIEAGGGEEVKVNGEGVRLGIKI
jgi:isoleucyl-tRNA synthetase